MKKFINNLLVLGILWSLFVMSACTSDNDLGIPELADGETVITLTASGVDESEDSAVRSDGSEPLEVISRPIGNGLSLQTCITQDNSAQTRGGNALATGSKFLVYIYQKAPKESSYTLRSWDSQIELIVGSQTPQTFALRQGFEYTLVCVAYLGSGGKSYSPAVAADQTINVTDFTKDYIKQNIYVDLRTDPATSKTVNFAFNHCLTKLTLEIDTSQMPGVYMKKNTAITYGSTNVKIPLSPDKSTYDYSGKTDKQVDLGYDNSSNSQSVVARTEMLLADQSTGRAKIDIAGLYLTNNPTENILKETYTLPFNTLLSPGKSYKVKVSVNKAGGVVVGDLIWASGNLYKAPDGTYKFYDAQETINMSSETGEYYGWNSLEPLKTSFNNWSDEGRWDPEKDPCSKVKVSGGGWRTPKVADVENLVKQGNTRLGDLNGVSGIFYVNGNYFTPKPAQLYVSDKFGSIAGTGANYYRMGENITTEDSGIAPVKFMAFWSILGFIHPPSFTDYEQINQSDFNNNFDRLYFFKNFYPIRCCKDKP